VTPPTRARFARMGNQGLPPPNGPPCVRPSPGRPALIHNAENPSAIGRRILTALKGKRPRNDPEPPVQKTNRPQGPGPWDQVQHRSSPASASSLPDPGT